MSASSLAGKSSPGALISPGRQSDDPAPRRDGLRLAVIASVALVIAAVVVTLVYVIGQHVVAAWWLESHRGAIVWEIDETNWRQGGATSVSFSRRFSLSALSDGDLEHLQKLHRVVRLSLAENYKFTAEGLAALSSLVFLRELDLARMDRFRHSGSSGVTVPLTDACLPYLKSLPRLESLALSGNLITDQGVAELAKLPNLKSVDLEATEVTDAGLVSLARMKNLERVDLGGTRVTREGIIRLQSLRPDLSVESDIDPALAERVKQSRGATP